MPVTSAHRMDAFNDTEMHAFAALQNIWIEAFNSKQRMCFIQFSFYFIDLFCFVHYSQVQIEIFYAIIL